MCKSLPASALAFSLYEACPFELPPVAESALSVTAPADDSGAALPEYLGVVSPVIYQSPLSMVWASGFEVDCYEHYGALDAPEHIPYGGVNPSLVVEISGMRPFFSGNNCVSRLG